MVQDLLADPKLGPRVDPNRVYVFGHSMGGTGALALATRYPQVFAAAYASQPMTAPDDAGPWVADAAMKWGEPAAALPVELDAPAGLAAPLARWTGTSVWRWQSHAVQVRERLGDEMAPFGVSHGRADKVLPFATQGRPAYAALDAGRRAWGGLVNDNEHSWAAFGGLPANLAPDRSLAPFYGFKVVRNEPVPGLSASSANALLPPPDAAGTPSGYNAGLEWAASWNPFAEPPEDTAARFCVSLRNAPDGPSANVEVDVTPRRTQAFRPGAAVRAEVSGADGKVRPLQVETPVPGVVTARRVPVGRAPVRVCLFQGAGP
jgi:pimeloyl-ACP methyl ester carboxylesterase